MSALLWPSLEYNHWKQTYATLHRWLQIIGKIRLCHEPWVNHSWSSTLYVTSRGLSTGAMPTESGNLSIEFDFVSHKLIFRSSHAQVIELALFSETVADFYARVMSVLRELQINIEFDPRPNELADDLPFHADAEHRTYKPYQAFTLWQILVRVNNAMKEFRSQFIGKCSPVHFFWGSFDLAVTRFSGRRAPEHPGGVSHLPDRVVREAYSHEVSSCGFWPGNELYPHAAFYSYAYPEPAGFARAIIQPSAAFYHVELKEFILPYDFVQRSENPESTLLSFFRSTYESAACLGHWNREILEESVYLTQCQKKLRRRPYSGMINDITIPEESSTNRSLQ